MLTGVFFWGFLLAYGALMYWLSPRTVTVGGFFGPRAASGGRRSNGIVVSFFGGVQILKTLSCRDSFLFPFFAWGTQPPSPGPRWGAKMQYF